MEWKTYALGSAFFAGLTAVLAKIGVEKIPSNLATLLRTGVILIFLVLLVFGRGEWRSPGTLPTRSLVFLVLSGITTGVSWLCYYRALQLGPASLVSSIDKLSLVFAVLFAVSVLHERLFPQQWAGIGLMVLGAYLTVR